MTCRRAMIFIMMAFVGISCRYVPYEGDGQLTDYGPFAGNRYQLELDVVSLRESSSKSYRIHGLPLKRFVFGLEIDLAHAVTHEHRFFVAGDPSVEMTLTNSDGLTIFTQRAPLSRWVWANTRFGDEAFVYGQFRQPESTGTYLLPDPDEAYALTVSVMADADGREVTARLVGRTGGWK